MLLTVVENCKGLESYTILNNLGC